jgi:hypothetical protein
MTEKVVGYLLVFVGVLVMVAAMFNIYSIFVLKEQPANLINMPSISLDMSNMVGAEVSSEQLESLKSQGKLTTELMSGAALNQPLNLAAHLFLVGFFLNSGFKLASLGVQFVRPIKVKLRESVVVNKSVQGGE